MLERGTQFSPPKQARPGNQARETKQEMQETKMLEKGTQFSPRKQDRPGKEARETKQEMKARDQARDAREKQCLRMVHN